MQTFSDGYEKQHFKKDAKDKTKLSIIKNDKSSREKTTEKVSVIDDKLSPPVLAHLEANKLSYSIIQTSKVAETMMRNRLSDFNKMRSAIGVFKGHDSKLQDERSFSAVSKNKDNSKVRTDDGSHLKQGSVLSKPRTFIRDGDKDQQCSRKSKGSRGKSSENHSRKQKSCRAKRTLSLDRGVYAFPLFEDTVPDLQRSTSSSLPSSTRYRNTDVTLNQESSTMELRNDGDSRCGRSSHTIDGVPPVIRQTTRQLQKIVGVRSSSQEYPPLNKVTKRYLRAQQLQRRLLPDRYEGENKSLQDIQNCNTKRVEHDTDPALGEKSLTNL